MGKGTGELEASALTAWTPAQQAALYQLHLVKQKEADEDEEYKKSRRIEGDDEVKPDQVTAATIVDNQLKKYCPPLHQFFELFGPPHRAAGVFLALHIIFWFMIPWYLRFMIIFPIVYFVPITCTLIEVYENDNRALWMAYWVELAILEYIELILFGNTARSLVWWPKIKAVFCLVLYSAVDWQDGSEKNSKGERVKVPVFGAITLIKPLLPQDPDDLEKQKKKEEEKAKKKSDMEKVEAEDRAKKKKAHEEEKEEKKRRMKEREEEDDAV